MSQEMSAVRSNASKVPSMLKQGNLLSAAQAVRKALHMLMSKALMRAEQEELQRLVQQGCGYLADNKEIRKLFPLTMEFQPGEEESLLDTLDQLIHVIQSDASEDAQFALQVAQYKADQLSKGQQELHDGLKVEANETFTALKDKFPADASLVTEIAQAYMDSGFYEEASQYFDSVLKLAPENIFALNRLGIALRKLKKFAMAESTFLTAISIDKTDAILHFNLGRLYLDWGELEKGLESAKNACALDPSFEEANKLGVYLQKKIYGH